MEILERVNELIADYLSEHGIELLDMSYRREAQGMVLRLLVDTQEGIRLSECGALNNFLSERLDSENLIDTRYIIEVSSPGLDRPLKTDRDFQRVIGRDLEIDTHEPVAAKNHIVGTLVRLDAVSVEVESSGARTVIPREKIARARQKIDF